MNKKFAFLALVLVIALSLAAAAPAVRAQDKIQLRLLGWSGSDAENKALNQVVADFNASQTEIEAKFEPVPDYDTVLQNALVGGDVPDVFYVSVQNFPTFVRDEVLMPYGDKLDNVEDFYPALRDSFSANDMLYCAPKDFSVLALQINTEMFEKAGLKPPTTWDEMKAAAKALATDSVAGFVLNPSLDRFAAFFYAAGGDITNADKTEMAVNSAENMAALEFLNSLYSEGLAKTTADANAGWGGEALGKGLAAMVMEGNWVEGFMKDSYPDVKYQTVELPAGPTGAKGSLAFTVCYGVAKNAKNPEASIKFINYLVGPDGMKTWTDGTGVLPSRMSLAEGFIKQFPEREVYLKSAEFAHGWGFAPGFNQVETKANEQLQLLIAGQDTIEDALKEIESVGNTVLAEANK